MIRCRLLMNKYPIHQNLNTSFVNLSALVRHLRGLQFVGSVRVELSSYEAEIEFNEDGTVKAREQDHIAGRLSFGDDALTRVMIRSMEPGGTINVYKDIAAADTPVYVDEAITNGVRKMMADENNRQPAPAFPARPAEAPSAANCEAPIPMPQAALELPSLDNWTELLGLISELMQTVDEAMAKGDVAAAVGLYTQAAERAPHIVELPFWQAVTLFSEGREAEALPIFRRVFAAEARWVELVQRLPGVGLLPDDPEKLEAILAVAPGQP